jgi:hypothetical protein
MLKGTGGYGDADVVALPDLLPGPETWWWRIAFIGGIRYRCTKHRQRSRSPAMKKALLSGIAVLSVLTASAAMSAEVPAQYRGLWCASRPSGSYYYRCRQATGEDSTSLVKTFISKSRTLRLPIAQPLSSSEPSKATGYTWACTNEPADIDIWLDARGHLRIMAKPLEDK